MKFATAAAPALLLAAKSQPKRPSFNRFPTILKPQMPSFDRRLDFEETPFGANHRAIKALFFWMLIAAVFCWLLAAAAASASFFLRKNLNKQQSLLLLPPPQRALLDFLEQQPQAN